MSFASSQGTTFSWDGVLFKCVDISYETSAPSRERLDASTLDLVDDAEMVMINAPLKPAADPAKFTITYKSEGTEIVAGVEATLSSADRTGTYFCTSASVSYKTNAYVEGQATFEEVPA